MEKSARFFLAVVAAFVILFVFTPNVVVMAGGGTETSTSGGGTSGSMGGGYSSGITLQQREQMETQLWNRVSEILISAWNQDNSYYAACSISPGSSGCSSAINNPEPGAYTLWASARTWDSDTSMTVYSFNGNAQTVIRPGENFASVKISLNPWQLVKIALPEAVSADKTVRLRFTINEYDGWNDMNVTDDGRLAWTFVPLSGTNFSLTIGDKTYPIPAEKIFGAIASSEPVSLVQLYVSVERLERYVRVPSEFSSIQAAVNFVPGGSTIVIEPGIYEERVDLSGKDDITLLGSPAYPRDVVIRSFRNQTIFVGSGAFVRLVGLTVENNYPGQKGGEKIWSDAAILFDLADGELDHVVVESTGVADMVVGNYSNLRIQNVTIAGSMAQDGIRMYDNGSNNLFQNILFYNLAQPIKLDNGCVQVSGSLFWKTGDMDCLKFDDTNTWGNPEFIGAYEWNRFLPSLDAPAIYWAIKKGDGNYPGALMPVRPNMGGRG